MTKRQLLANTDSWELTEWQAYFRARELEREDLKKVKQEAEAGLT